MKYEEYCEKVKEYDHKCKTNTLRVRDYSNMISLIGEVDSTVLSQDIRSVMYADNINFNDLESNLFKAASATMDYLSPDYVIKDVGIKRLVQVIERVVKGETVGKDEIMPYVDKYDWCHANADWKVLQVASQTLSDIRLEAIYNADLKLALSQSTLTPFSDIEPEREE